MGQMRTMEEAGPPGHEFCTVGIASPILDTGLLDRSRWSNEARWRVGGVIEVDPLRRGANGDRHGFDDRVVIRLHDVEALGGRGHRVTTLHTGVVGNDVPADRPGLPGAGDTDVVLNPGPLARDRD